MHNIEINITGMSCSGCAQSIERRLLTTRGIAQATADFSAGLATVRYDDQVIAVETIVDIIASLGFTVTGYVDLK